jgi:hypothetical protein
VWLAAAAIARSWFGVQLAPDALEALVGISLIGLGIVNFGEHPSHPERHGGPRLAFLFGLLHGSAGATHLLALLPTLGLPPTSVLAYAAGYLCAGIVAMAGAASLFGRLSGRVADVRHIRRACAAAAALLGAVWLLRALVGLA